MLYLSFKFLVTNCTDLCEISYGWGQHFPLKQCYLFTRLHVTLSIKLLSLFSSSTPTRTQFVIRWKVKFLLTLPSFLSYREHWLNIQTDTLCIFSVWWIYFKRFSVLHMLRSFNSRVMWHNFCSSFHDFFRYFFKGNESTCCILRAKLSSLSAD